MSYIKLDRKIIDSEVFAHDGQFRFWVWLLTQANYKTRFTAIKIGAGQSTVEVKRGELIFGRNSVSSILGVKPATLYIWLQRFKEMKMVELKSNKHFTIVTICKYEEYQTPDSDKVATDSQPDSHQLATIYPPFSTPKEIQERKEVKEEYIPADEPPATQTPKFDFKQSLINSGANEQHVSDLMAARKKKNLVNTETALKLFIGQAGQLNMTISEAVEYCAGRSWGGLRVEYVKKETTANNFTGKEEAEMIAYIDRLNDFDWDVQKSKLIFDTALNSLFHPEKHKYIGYDTLCKCSRLMKYASDIFRAKSLNLTPAIYGQRNKTA